MWSCMWNPLPNLTRSCARGANAIGVFGLVRGPLTRCYQSTDLAVCHSHVVLPIITGRGVKYTHNDHINPTVPTHSGGPGLRRIPQGRHQSLEVVTHHTHDPVSTHGQGPAVLTPRPRQSWLATANTRAKQVNLVMIP